MGWDRYAERLSLVIDRRIQSICTCATVAANSNSRSGGLCLSAGRCVCERSAVIASRSNSSRLLRRFSSIWFGNQLRREESPNEPVRTNELRWSDGSLFGWRPVARCWRPCHWARLLQKTVAASEGAPPLVAEDESPILRASCCCCCCCSPRFELPSPPMVNEAREMN